MSALPIRVLQVEDDSSIRRLVSHHLRGLENHEFTFDEADRQDEAMKLFEDRAYELVILDYDLPQGNGLDLLKWLRAKDAYIPVIALSGVASAEIAAELLAVGADDYISKAELTAPSLQQSVQQAILRTRLFKTLAPTDSLEMGGETAEMRELRKQVTELAEWFVTRLDFEFLNKLSAIEERAAALEIGPVNIQNLLEQVSEEVAHQDPDATNSRRFLLRPLLLELLVRMIG